MKRKNSLNRCKSDEDTELAKLLADASLSPTEKYYRGRVLTISAYVKTGREMPNGIEPIIRIGKFGEEDDDG